ncbi:MAG: cyanophycinase [Leptolyngbyaceae cyanobacterium SL_1_1]|nr:cyanophycinase [Leptolyngbyaceae cyanobacterium RM1_1_2]NJO08434.1 cyanophycinase [Leptolyngbyaceae cyanobacterium SL_1_1]
MAQSIEYQDQSKGPLVIIGGAEDRDEDCTILREFVRLAGGTKAHIAVLTAATAYFEETGAEYDRVFTQLGAAAVDVVHTQEPKDANDPRLLEIVADATGVFFTGGDQSRVIRVVQDSLLEDLLHKRHREGVVIGGTSAGAAIMPEVMIAEGDSTTHPYLNAVEMSQGMGFLTQVLVDQHFAQRGRLGRLLTALLLEPSVLGLGIDENTAVIVQGDTLEVIGEGAATVVDESGASHNNLSQLLRDEAMAVFGVRLHILPHGYRFNLKTRQPSTPADSLIPEH